MANALLATPMSRRRTPPGDRPPVRLVASAVVLLTALGWAALAAAEGSGAGVYGPALAVAVVAALAGGLESRRTSSRWSRDARPVVVDDILDLPPLEVPQTEADLEADLVAETQAVLEPVDGSREDRTVRTLRAQVHALEQALDQVQGVLAVRQQEAASSEAHRRAVLLTVQAVADRTAHAAGAGPALARVAAAVERLGAPDVFARPVLPPPGYGEPVIALIAPVVPQTPAEQSLAEQALAEPAAQVSAPEPALEPVTPVESAIPVEPVTPVAPVSPAAVLPVPPRPVAAPVPGRSWRRTRAGAGRSAR